MKKLLFLLTLTLTLMPTLTPTPASAQTFDIESYNFKAGKNMSAPAKSLSPTPPSIPPFSGDRNPTREGAGLSLNPLLKERELKNNKSLPLGGDLEEASNFRLVQRQGVPFCQAAVKQTTEPAKYGQTSVPYYTVRYALPIPAAYTPTEQGELVGLDKGVYTHMHSAGMDVMPNGDIFAVYFSTPAGKSEADTITTFVQARLRCGSLEWDMPELFFDTHNANDQSALVWRDGKKVWFFGGGRDISDWVPFRYTTTTDNGVTWEYNTPKLSAPATSYTAQPISNAFRSPNGDIFFTSDGDGSTSFLWKSSDNGVSWTQLAGRTSGRHSTILPLDNNGTLLSIGGKNASIDGWNPQNISHDWGATWEEGTKSPFPPLGTAQRPCMIRLQSGNLLLVSDSYMHKKKIAPPAGWQNGNDCVVALSKDNGKTWIIKSLPITLPQHHRVEHPSLGYVTLRQADNGIIHILTTTNYPGLDIEFNEAWVLSEARSLSPTLAVSPPALPSREGAEVSTLNSQLSTLNSQPSREGAEVNACANRGQSSSLELPRCSQGSTRSVNANAKAKAYKEKYPSGKPRIKWHAKIYSDGRYLLDGKEVSYYENGQKEHEVTYKEGRKTGTERFWSPDGQLIWKWERNLKTNTGVWTQYYVSANANASANAKIVSTWNLMPTPRDLPGKSFIGYVAEGPATHYDINGNVTATYMFHNGVTGDAGDATSAGILNEGK